MLLGRALGLGARLLKRFAVELGHLVEDVAGFCTGLGAVLLAHRLVSLATRSQHFKIREPQVHRVLHERDARVIHHLSLQLPAWVKDPSLERVTWLNLVLARFWPVLTDALDPLWCTRLWPAISKAAQLPPELLAFRRFNLGRFPPTIEYVKSIPTPDDECVIEAKVQFRSNASVVAEAAARGMSSLVHLSEVQFACVLRLSLAPLTDDFPCFDAINFSFMEAPEIDAKLTLGGVDLLSFFPIENLVKSRVQRVVARNLLWPRWLSCPLSPAGGAAAEAHRRRAVGSLQIRVVAAHDLGYIFIPSPFVKVIVETINGPGAVRPLEGDWGHVRTVSTSALSHTRRPLWNEQLRIVVYDSETDIVKLELRDGNAFLMDGLMGACAFPVSFVKETSFERSLLLTLKSAEGEGVGTLEVIPKYLPLYQDSTAKRSASLSRGASARVPEAWVPGVVPPSRTYGSGGGVLEVHVRRAADLEVTVCTQEEWVYCRMLFAMEEHCTQMVPAASHPTWNECFDFLCMPEDLGSRMRVEVWHSEQSLMARGGHRKTELGSVEVDLTDVLRNRRIVDLFSLEGKQGYIKLELVWLFH